MAASSFLQVFGLFGDSTAFSGIHRGLLLPELFPRFFLFSTGAGAGRDFLKPPAQKKTRRMMMMIAAAAIRCKGG